MGSFIQGLAAADRYLRQRFTALPSKALASCSTGSEQGDHSLAGRVCRELSVSKATFFGLIPPCAPGSTFNLWLGNSDMAGGARNFSSTQEHEQRTAKDVPGARNPI